MVKLFNNLYLFLNGILFLIIYFVFFVFLGILGVTTLDYIFVNYKFVNVLQGLTIFLSLGVPLYCIATNTNQDMNWGNFFKISIKSFIVFLKFFIFIILGFFVVNFISFLYSLPTLDKLFYSFLIIVSLFVFFGMKGKFQNKIQELSKLSFKPNELELDIKKMKYFFTFKRILYYITNTFMILFIMNLLFVIFKGFLSFLFPEKISELVNYNYINYLNFALIIFLCSLILNAVVFFTKSKVINDQEKGNFEEFIKKLMESFFKVSFIYLISILFSYFCQMDLRIFFFSTITISSLIFYYFENGSTKLLIDYLTQDEPPDVNIKSAENVGVNMKQAENVNLLDKESINELNNSTLPVFNEKIMNLLISFYNLSSFDIRDKRVRWQINKKVVSQIDLLIHYLDLIFSEDNLELSFEKKVVLVVFLFYQIINKGRKAVPMLVLGYLIYLYQKEKNEYLKGILKRIINIRNINTPTRMVEMIISWQYLHKINLNYIPSIKKLPKFIKKNLKKILENYDFITLKKNKLSKRSIKLKDLIKILHPKPKDYKISILYSSIILNTKFSKLNEKEYVPMLLKNEFLIQSIKNIPIQALLKNLHKINFENNTVANNIKEKLRDVSKNMENLQRFINILDFYIPIFSVNTREAIKVIRKMEMNEMENLKEKFGLKNLSQDVVISIIVDKLVNNVVNEYFLNLTGPSNFDNIEKLSFVIELILELEKMADFSYTNLNSHQVEFKILKNIKEIKELLNETIQTYLNKNQRKQEISIFINIDYKGDFDTNLLLNLAKAVSILTSLYPNYKLAIVGDKFKDYTNFYINLTKNDNPIDKMLKTFSFLVEAKRSVDFNSFEYSFGSILENIQNYSNRLLIVNYNDGLLINNYSQIIYSFIKVLKKMSSRKYKIISYTLTNELKLNELNFANYRLYEISEKLIDFHSPFNHLVLEIINEFFK